MKNTELEKYLNESRNIYFNNNVRGYSTLISIFSDLSKVSYDRSESLIEEHLYHKFLNSNSKNFDKFLKSYLGEEGVQISANIPQAVRPERPVEEEELEELDEAEDSEESDSEKENDSEEEDDDLTDDDRVIENFLDEIGLLHLEEEEVERFIYRFVYVLEDTFDDKDTLNLIASLLYKARMKPEELSDGDKDELTDIIFHLSMNPEEAEEESKGETKEESYIREMYDLDRQIFTLMSEKDDDEKDKGDIKSKTKNAVHKVGVVSVLAGSAFLFGIGGLFAAGLFLFLTRSSDKDLEKTKEDCTKNKDNFSSGTPVKIENPKPVSNPTPPPKEAISEISSKGESSKEDLVARAKTVAESDPNFAKKQEAKSSWKDKFKAASKYVGAKGVELLGKGAKAVGNLAVDAAKAGYNIATSEPVKSAVKKGLDVAADVGKAGLEKGKELAKKGLEKGSDLAKKGYEKGKELATKGVKAVKDKFSKEPEEGEGPKAKKKGKSKDGKKIASKGDAQKYFDAKGKAPDGWESDPTGKVYQKGKKPPAKKKAPAKKKPATNKPKKPKAESYLYNLLF